MSKKKEILLIDFEIPGKSENTVSFGTNKSFMDADIIVISASNVYPNGDWISFSSSGGGCYDTNATKRFIEKTNRLKKEINDSLKLGKTVFLFLSPKKEHSLATGVTHPRKGQNLYSTTTRTNYDFLPISIGTITSATGNNVIFSGNSVFSEFNRQFKDNLKYEAYLENCENAIVTYFGKDKSKVLGAIYKVNTGHFVIMPELTYDHDIFVAEDEETEEEIWTEEALKFGNKLTQALISIDKSLSSETEKTPAPEWLLDNKYSTKKSVKIESHVIKLYSQIDEIKEEIENLKVDLQSENRLKDLLFEQGKPLENAVTEALEILGFKAENYDDGELELDQVILSPENIRYIGECEGKDNKEINITKFRQLLESLNADFSREEVDEKAYGILFGNPQRLEIPEKRKLGFTKKCITGAEREKIALVKTTDLFEVTNYLKQNKSERFKKSCRKAIFEGLGKVVVFPEAPKSRTASNNR